MDDPNRFGKLLLQDAEYQKLLKECVHLEKRLFKALETVPSETNDLVWDYIMLCESMNARRLRLARMYGEGVGETANTMLPDNTDENE